MKRLAGAVALLSGLVLGATPAPAQIPDVADAALWAGLNSCQLEMSLSSGLARRLSAEGFQPIDRGMRWSAGGDVVDAVLDADRTSCIVTARGPGFERAAVETWMADWADSRYTPRVTGQTTVWHRPTSIMIFAYRDGAMQVRFGGVGSSLR